MMALDGIIQYTERNKFSYQEIIVNLPLCSHPNLQNGGDYWGQERGHPVQGEVVPLCEVYGPMWDW